MNKDEVEKLCQDSYRRGYREGFEDACKQVEGFSKDLSDKAYEQAQKDWEKEKREILDGLNESIDDVDNRFEGEPWAETVCEKINQAIEFLEKARF